MLFFFSAAFCLLPAHYRSLSPFSVHDRGQSKHIEPHSLLYDQNFTFRDVATATMSTEMPRESGSAREVRHERWSEEGRRGRGRSCRNLVDLDALVAKLVLGLLNLAKERLVRLRRVVEAEEAETERRERVRAKRDEEPPRDLGVSFSLLRNNSFTPPPLFYFILISS